jgi:hypothetical protein
MQEIQAGRVILWGIASDPPGTQIVSGGSNTTGGSGQLPGNAVSGYAFILSTVPVSHQFELDHVVQEQKFTVNLTASDENVECELDFTISGTSQATILAALNAANTAASNTRSVFPSPHSKVTLQEFAVEVYNGDWIYIGGAKLECSAGVPNKYTGIKLRKYADQDQMNIFFPDTPS